MVVTSRYLPVFPLGTAVLPAQLVPLHIFEPRYRALLATLADSGPAAELGFVLIERGSEVGGGDLRTGIGTLAHLIEADELPDGRWAAIFAGSHRFRVDSWMEDDPYPQAVVEELAESEWDEGDAHRLAEAEEAVTAALALAARLGEARGAGGFTLAPDPVVGAWQLCARAPLGPLDRQRLLVIDSRSERLDALIDMTREAAKLLAFRLGEG